MSEEAALVRFIQDSLLNDRAIRITPETRLFEERILDSMNILHLLGYVERRLRRRLTDDEIVMANFQSVRAMVAAFFAGTSDG